MSKIKKTLTTTDYLNEATFIALANRYKSLAINAFKWSNLPTGIEEEYIEYSLYTGGKVCFFKDNDGVYKVLPCTYGNGFNIYGEPLSFNVYGYNFNRVISADNCVPIYNNKLREPTEPIVMFYIHKIFECERTLDMNIKTQRVPLFVSCTPNTVLSYKTAIKKLQNFEDLIIADKNLNLDNLKVVDLKTEFNLDKIMEYKHNIENELLTYLGVNNIPVEKKERLITGEVESNNQQLDENTQIMLDERQKCVEKINEKYGLDITVERRCENVGRIDTTPDGFTDFGD